ncbi:MAG: XdhC family protein [Bacteroidia bacterium]|nr:XdhC family protein [Bacteroidia bacterium]
MKDIYSNIQNWKQQGQKVALATVLSTWGSAPRPIGSHMAISQNSEMAGSVSGGCVEGAVVRQAQKLINEGGGEELHYGITDDEAWEVGLSCGGKLDVWLEKWGENEAWEALEDHLENEKPAIWISQLRDNSSRHALLKPDGSSIGSEVPENIKEAALDAFQKRIHVLHEADDQRWFLRVIPPKSSLYIIGAAHISVDLVKLAQMYGFETHVIDPRGLFAQKTTFDVKPDHMAEAYPSEVLKAEELNAYDYAVVLSHDPKIDDNALEILLNSQVAYIGVLGSKRNQAKREKRLTEKGFGEEDFKRIHGPIGIGIGAKGASEIALSIMAEVIAVKNKFR